MATTTKPLQAAPRDIQSIQAQQSSLTLDHFTADDAFNLGISLRTRIRSLSPSPAVINITSTNNDSLLFHCCTRPGITPDNDIWVSRKRNTVKRWGVSSWYMGRKFDGDEEMFAKKYALGQRAGEYAIHGGGVPVRVKGVEGVVAVVVVSGLKQDEDHMVVVEALEEVVAATRGSGLVEEDGGGLVEEDEAGLGGKTGKVSDDVSEDFAGFPGL